MRWSRYISKSEGQRGLTLLEMVLAIAILAVLATVIVPMGKKCCESFYGNRINLCIGSQIADTITMKCDVSDISFFVDNHGSFLFMISHSKGVIHGGSTRFESLDWANEHNHLQGYLDKITEER